MSLDMEDSHVVTRYMAGQQNRQSPFEHAPSRDSMSHNWRGPGFYSTHDAKFILLKDTTYDPPDSRPASYSRHPERVPTSTLSAYADDPWTRQWRGPGAGFYSPLGHTWRRELPGQTIATDSRLFINEEDWLKYKYMCANPKVAADTQHPLVVAADTQHPLEAAPDTHHTDTKDKETQNTKRFSPRQPRRRVNNILSDYF